MKIPEKFSARLRSSFFALGLAALVAIQPVHLRSLEKDKPLSPEQKHKVSGKVIAKLLRQYHYNHEKINDLKSAEMLDLYIERFDRNHMYFLASDIQSFEQYRETLDDDIVSGNLDPGYLIFNTLQTRLDQRMAYVNTRLETEFDFNIAESYQVDRSEEAWPATTREQDELWRKKLKNEALNLKLTDKDWPGIQKTLKKRYANLQRRIGQYKSEDVFQHFMNALSETFDPHTSYFSPISSDNFGIDMSLSLQGIGAQLSTEDEYTKVVRIIPGGPADRSKGIWANDKIVGVAQDEDGEMLDVIGMRLDDVVQKIRGPKGSVVRLQIIPADNAPGSPPTELKLVRDKVVLEERAAKSDTVEFMHDGSSYKLGVINIPTFYIDLEAQRRGDPNYKSTTRDVRRLIKELQGANVDGIMIDLRRNGGGSLQEAIELTGLFIEDGPVVQVKSSIGSKRVESDPDPGIAYAGPLGVMVDRFSASASEIFASAIQDYGRGLIIGSQTYGKGTVQNLLGLNRFIRANDERYGQVKVTIAKFYRITGSTTQHRGVIPDINFPSIYNEMDFGENKQLHALPWDEISPAMFKPNDQVSMFLAPLRINSKKRKAKNREFQYVVEDINEYKAEQNRNSVSLREADREARRKRLEAKKLARVNERRAGKGLQPLEEGDKIPDDDKTPDADLEEAQLVMADMISLAEGDGAGRIAKRKGPGPRQLNGRSETAKTPEQEKN